MNLSFQTKWKNKKPNYFIEKIWQSTKEGDFVMIVSSEKYFRLHFEKFGIPLVRDKFQPKKHTLREDKKDRWKEGKVIHFIINNRTPNRFQFMPILPVLSTQKVVISQFVDIHTDIKYRTVKIGDTWKWSNYIKSLENDSKILEFVKNDGFDDVDSFFDYFFPKKGKLLVKELKLIHWTPLKYE